MIKLKWSYFDSYVGEYDKYNPRFVYDIKYVPNISYIIAINEPYSLTIEDIKSKLNISYEECDNAVDAMLKINAITENNNKYKINFPVFLERDLDLINDFCIDIGKRLGDKIIALSDKVDALLKQTSAYNNFGLERIRYHAIACDTLDGVALDYYANKGLINISKIQPDNRDYLIIAHEDSPKASKYSERLLCSCNKYMTDKFMFMSFGDGDGYRHDFMRFFTRLNKNIESTTENKDLNTAYLSLLNDYNSTLTIKSGKLLEKVTNEPVLLEKENHNLKIIEFLKLLGYIKVKDGFIICNVPIFNSKDIKLIEEVGLIIVEQLYSDVKLAINELGKSMPHLTSIKHGVDSKDIANELWHLVFGSINEYLVKTEFIKKPEYKVNEGRYLQTLYIHD